MNYKSIITDAEIARLLLDGISLDGKDAKQQYEAIKQLGEGLDSRLTEFGNNVEASLDVNVKSLLEAVEERQAIEHVQRYASSSVNDLIHNKVKKTKSRTRWVQGVHSSTTYLEEDLVEVSVEVYIYSILKNELGQDINDYKRFLQMLNGLRAIRINGTSQNGRWSLKRTEDPKYREINPPVVMGPEKKPFNVGVYAKYAEVFPKEILVASYNQQMQKP